MPSYDLVPLQARYAEITSDTSYLDNILAEGASKAASIADVTVNNVYQAMGFLRRWAQSTNVGDAPENVIEVATSNNWIKVIRF